MTNSNTSGKIQPTQEELDKTEVVRVPLIKLGRAEMVPPIPQQDIEQMPGVQANTSPAFPPIPDDGASPMAGIETPTITDNIGA